MQTFEDAKGQKWDLEITVGVIKRVRSALDIDLVELDAAVYKRLDDPVMLVDLLWLICEEQANGRKVSDEDFGRGLAGDPIEHATNALLGAVADFFPGRKRSLMQTMISKTATLQEAATKMAMDKIEDPEMEKTTLAALQRQMDAEVTSALTRLSGPTSSPERPASTPAASR